MTDRERALSLIAADTSSGPDFFRVAARALIGGTHCQIAGISRLVDGGLGEELTICDANGDTHLTDHDPEDGLVSGLFLIQETGSGRCRAEPFYDAYDRPAGLVFVLGPGRNAPRPSTATNDDDLLRLIADRVGAEYRRWQAEEERMVELMELERRQPQLELLAELAVHETLAIGDIDSFCQAVTRRAAEVGDVERVSVWLFDRERRKLQCRALRDKTPGGRTPGGRTPGGRTPGGRGTNRLPADLVVDECPYYIEALGFGRPIASRLASSDPRTRELGADYLIPAGIVSTLEAPIQAAGPLLGALRFEHTGEPRAWRDDEIAFAEYLASMVAVAVTNRERRSFARRLAQAQKTESLSVLAGGIAHDFNNLLVGVLGGTDLAQVHLPPETPSRRHLEMIGRSAIRASELCSQMLAYAGRGQFLLEAVDLSVMIKDSLESFRSMVPDGIDFDVHLAKNLPAIDVDTAQMRQVVFNLLANAREAIADSSGSDLSGSDLAGSDLSGSGPLEVGARGKITITTGVRDCTHADFEDCLPADELIPGRHVYLEITDTGSGMDEATRSRVCEPFFTTKFTGRGLGLSAVFGIVRSQGGGLCMCSDVGSGTTIRLYFPEAETAIGVGFAPVAGLEDGETRGTILVVDDEDIVRQVVAEMLHSWGFSCLLAEGGRRAIDVFEQQSDAIDLVLLDVTMPDLPGEQVLDHLHRRRPELPVIMASGFSEQDLAERFAGREIAGFIHKPFHPEKLQEILRHALSRRAERRLRAIS